MTTGTITGQLTAIAAIIAITTILLVGLWQDIQDVPLSLGLAAIAGLGGYQLNTVKNSLGNQKSKTADPTKP